MVGRSGPEDLLETHPALLINTVMAPSGPIATAGTWKTSSSEYFALNNKKLYIEFVEEMDLKEVMDL